MQSPSANDVAGAETLEIMSAAPRYNAWQYELIAPYLGKRVLEVGSGIGNISGHIVAHSRQLVVLTDTDEWYRERLRARFEGREEVAVATLTLPDDEAPMRFASHDLDTVVALNVVEHIPDDVGALRTMGRMVRPAGRVVVLVPALEGLFGSLDRELQHQRRYTRRSLRSVMESAGLRVDVLRWFNRVGTVGWWWNARVRRAPRIPVDQLRAFDSLVPLLRFERYLPLPFGQSLIAVGVREA